MKYSPGVTRAPGSLAEAEGMAEPQRPVRILLVDEEETLAHVVSLAFSLEGWQTTIAPTGADALALADAHDIVLLDMMLPDMLGTSVAAELRERGSDIAIVFLTGRSEHEQRLAAYRAGADSYVTKPFGLEELVDHLQPIVRRLGLSPASRRVDDLVLDVESGNAWRGGERLELTSLEFEVLRDLVESRGIRLDAAALVSATARRGIRIPREYLGRMLARIVAAVNRVGRPLVLADDFGWQIA